MMSGCSSYDGHVMGACTCGMFHSQTNSFPMLYPNQNPYGYEYDESDMYSSFTPSSSSVDCTLSLGTPSTRLTQDEEKRNSRNERRRSVSNMCWDLSQSNQSHSNKSSRGTNSSSSSNDALLARRCANCDTTSTPLWRNGPRGPKSLCNACGIRFKKEERRASAAAAAATASASSGVMESQAMYSDQDNYWYAQSYSQGQRMPCLSPAMVDDGNGDSENGMPFLSWRLNVTDRPSLVHDFTR